MADVVIMPQMAPAQEQAWHALMEVHSVVSSGWTLIGGQLVHLHCAERGSPPLRPTTDIDAVLDVRADPGVLHTFTHALTRMGFAPVTTGDGLQHRWLRGAAQIDVLIPDGIGQRAAQRPGFHGAPTLSAPGTTQALKRSETVAVQVAGMTGQVNRPNLVGAILGKASARTRIVRDPGSERHCSDFVVLAALLGRRDFEAEELSRGERSTLRRMLAICRASEEAQSIDRVHEHLERLERAAGLT